MGTGRSRRDNPRRTNGPIRLPADLDGRLSTYASAAVAAGVNLLASTQVAEAKIVYTPAHIQVNSMVMLDLNHDGLADFFITPYGSGSGSALYAGCALHSTYPSPPKGVACNYLTNQIWGRGVVSGRFASALRAGAKVRPSKAYFQAASYPFQAVMGAKGVFKHYYSFAVGQWLQTKNRYLGLQFVINEEVHYGWARLSVLVDRPSPRERGLSVVLTGYAYETIPNKPIITGKTKGPDVVTLAPVTLAPATLGYLAQGASQIPAWRAARNRFGARPDLPRRNGQVRQIAP